MLSNVDNGGKSLEQTKILLRLLFLVAALSLEGRKLVIELNARKIVIDCLKTVLSTPYCCTSTSSDFQ